MSTRLTTSLSAEPILSAADRYRGTIYELTQSQVVTSDQFARLRQSLALKIVERGLRSADRVVVAIPNGHRFIAALLAILTGEGAPLVLHYKTPVAELRRTAMRFGAKFVICEPSEETALRELAAATTPLELVDGSLLAWARMNEWDPDFREPAVPLPGVPLHPTSGSTGLPKLAVRPGFAAMEEARHYAETMQVTAQDTILALPPMSHAYGFGTAVMLPLLTGASIVSVQRFTARAVGRALSSHNVTIFPAVPAMLHALAGEPGAALQKLRFVLTAGSLLPKRAADEFREKTGVVACPLYGTTETGGISVATTADGSHVNGRVGPAMQGVAVEVRHIDSNAELGSGVNKLFVRSSSMMAGYLSEQGEITSPGVDGWFETGDLACMDDDGVIHLKGRDGEVVNLGGLKVVPCEVEEIVALLPGVREVKVYGGQYRWGTPVLKVALAVENGLTEAQIRAYCDEHLVYYKRPQIISLVDALPRSPAGKIVADQLP